MSKPRFKTRRIVNDKAKIQDKEECQHIKAKIQDRGVTNVRMRRVVNDKAKIQDKEEYQCQSQDSGQGGLSMTRLRFRIRRSTNVKAKIRDKEGCQ